jgi:hypothetical protein
MPESKAGISSGKGCGGKLIPAKPGEVRNPHGINGATKRRQQLQEICQRVLGKQVDVSKAGKVYKMSGIEAICEAMRNEAIKGDVGAATWCRDTAYGKPVQAITGDLNVNATVSLSESAALMNGRVIPKAGE